MSPRITKTVTITREVDFWLDKTDGLDYDIKEIKDIENTPEFEDACSEAEEELANMDPEEAEDSDPRENESNTPDFIP